MKKTVEVMQHFTVK